MDRAPTRSCRRLRRALGVGAVVAAGLVCSRAQAKDDEQGRPWARGTWAVSPSLGVGFSRDLIPLTLGVGGSYFVAHGLGLGLSVNDTIFIYSSSFKSRFPDVNNQIPTNSVFVTPTARYVFYRNHRFSPYVFGALGPVFFNHGGGTRGYWAAGPAVLIGIGGPIYLNLGVTFSGIFPADECLESFEYAPPDSPGTAVQFDLGCGFGWGPSIGISFAPRGKAPLPRRKRASPRDRTQGDGAGSPPNPLSEPEAEGAADPPVAGAATASPGVVPSGSPADAVRGPAAADPEVLPAAPPSAQPAAEPVAPGVEPTESQAAPAPEPPPADVSPATPLDNTPAAVSSAVEVPPD